MCPISSPTVRRSGSHAAMLFVLGVLSGAPAGPMAAQTYAMKTTAAVDYIATRAEREEMMRVPMRARLVFRSPRMAPVYLEGMVTCRLTMGSNSTGWACRKAALKAMRPAVLNACSELSTAWSLPK